MLGPLVGRFASGVGILPRSGGYVPVDWHEAGANQALADHGVGQSMTSVIDNTVVDLKKIFCVADQGYRSSFESIGSVNL